MPHTIAGLTGARFLGGLAVGVSSMVAPMYIAEVAPARIRGRLVTLNQLAIVSGILLANLVSLFLVDASNNWRLMFASAAIPAFVLLVALCVVPESPRWLAKQGQNERARAILERINGRAQAALELQEIRIALAQEGGSFAELLRPGLRGRARDRHHARCSRTSQWDQLDHLLRARRCFLPPGWRRPAKRCWPQSWSALQTS